MKIDVPRIVRPLRLSEYQPEYDTVIQVWVNPPRRLLFEQLGRLETIPVLKKAGDVKGISLAGEALLEWLREIWSQGADPETHWSLDELRELVAHTMDTDPGLWRWLNSETVRLIQGYRAEQKKE